MSRCVQRRGAEDRASRRRDGLVVCTSAPACDAGAAVLARGGNAVDAAVATAFALAVTHPSGRQHRRRRLHDRPRRAGERPTTFDYREKAPLEVDARRCTSNGRRQDRSPADRGRLSRARRARHRARARARAQEVRQAAVEGRRHAGGASSPRRASRCQPALARGLNRELAGADGAVPGVGRGVRQAGRRRVGGRRPARPRRISAGRCGAIATDGPTPSTRAGSPTASPRT